MRQKHLSTIIALGVALAFIVVIALGVTVSGCATLNKVLGIKDYYTIDMYMADGTPMPTNFPNEWPIFEEENSTCMPSPVSPNIYMIMCFIEGNELLYQQFIEYHTGRDIALIISGKDGTFKGWIYDDKGIPVKANKETVTAHLNDNAEKIQKGDSI